MLTLGATGILSVQEVEHEILSVADTLVAFRVAPEIFPIATISPSAGSVNTLP
jgi:hypothetical protein